MRSRPLLGCPACRRRAAVTTGVGVNPSAWVSDFADPRGACGRAGVRAAAFSPPCLPPPHTFFSWDETLASGASWRGQCR